VRVRDSQWGETQNDFTSEREYSQLPFFSHFFPPLLRARPPIANLSPRGTSADRMRFRAKVQRSRFHLLFRAYLDFRVIIRVRGQNLAP
jgi:hypothetical protein